MAILVSWAILTSSLGLANYAAGIVVEKMGTPTVSPEELTHVIQEKG